MNKAQPAAEVELREKQWAAMTYGSGLRVGDDDGELLEARRTSISEDCLVSVVHGKVQIKLYHGLKDPDEELDDWGFDAEGVLLADAVHTRPEGLYLLDFSGKKARARVIPFIDDLLVFGGSYYGDVSLFPSEAK